MRGGDGPEGVAPADDDDVVVADDGVVTVTIKLTIGGCPLRADIKRDVESRLGLHPGVSDVRIEWGEMTPEERAQALELLELLSAGDFKPDALKGDVDAALKNLRG